ncbi:putative GTP-binding protein 6 [Styela clava]
MINKLFSRKILCVGNNLLRNKYQTFVTYQAAIPLRRVHCSANFYRSIDDEYEDNEPINDIIDSEVLKLGDHNVFVIQPDLIGEVRPHNLINTTTELQLEESVALVECLPGWKVSGKMILKTRTPHEQRIFRGERLERLKEQIVQHQDITAIFLSLNGLNGLQRKYISDMTRIESIFDRYSLVLEIFRLRAQTKQAKLQVALAEIPYLRTHSKSELASYNRQGRGHGAVGGPGETPMELLKRQFKIREQKIRSRLTELSKHRTYQRQAKRKNNIPVVAVVGYTNAGKTTLIKALTKSERLEPKNHLFATLDVTTHSALSCGNLRYLLIDTVGFLSDLPHSLIDAFSATMEDMLQADMIIHVSDISHPDYKNQKMNVYKVLSDLNLPEKLLENMIEVQNKIDLLPDTRNIEQKDSSIPIQKEAAYSKRGKKLKRHHLYLQPSSTCMVSATEGPGLDELNKIIHDRLVKVTGSSYCKIKVPADGDHMDWFNQFANVNDVKTDGDFHFIFDVVISQPMLNKFKSKYSVYDILSGDVS